MALICISLVASIKLEERKKLYIIASFFARPTAVENVNKTDVASALRRLQIICLLSRIKFKVVKH